MSKPKFSNDIKSGYYTKTPSFIIPIGILEMLSFGLIISNHILSGMIIFLIINFFAVISA